MTSYLGIFSLLSVLLASCYAPQRGIIEQKISTALTEQENLNSFIKRVNAKNDSLYSAGNITDQPFNEYAQSLKALQVGGNEITEGLQNQLARVKSRTAYHDYYQDINAYTNNFLKQGSTVNSQKTELLKIIDKKLDESDLSKEKGRLNGMLNNADAQQEKEAATLSDIDKSKDELLSSGNVNTTTASEVDNRLALYQKRMDSLSSEIQLLRKQLNNPEDVKKGFSIIRSKITLVDSVVNKSASLREYKFSMISEALQYAKPNLFSLAAFFGPGGFKIPIEKQKSAEGYFSPVIDSLLTFANKYENILRTATIMVEGYADGSSIAPNSNLAKTVSNFLGEKTVQRELLNGGLSAMRAEEISRLLNVIVKNRYPEFKSINKIVFENIVQGKGEAFPNVSIKNYTTNDERRKLVIIYWNVLPVD
jgi:hypothetical protein